MTDKMQEALSKLNHNELVEALDGYDRIDYYEEGFKTGYQARDQESQWIPIDEIPEEWKDGREVDLWITDGHRYPNAYWNKNTNSFFGVNGGPISHIFRNSGHKATHAMLPQTPPKEL